MPALQWKQPLLDARLQKAMELAPPCRLCADIGADHGQLSAALLLSGRAERVLVTDVSEKSLTKAKTMLGGLGLEQHAVFSVADGLLALDCLHDEVPEVLFILGMGGETLSRILERGADRLRGATLILGAQTDLPLLRGTLCKISYRIRQEVVATESGRSYILMQCTPSKVGEPAYDEEELLLGPLLSKELPALWKPMLERRRAVLERAVSSMQGAQTEKGRQRLPETLQELGYIQKALERYETKGGNPE
ncbi:MAG: class I SAM-dependent methyltransferase [Eubacteriales bacterium]|nr:class I SAM-dependent methyltransferase [Eubacteriales bacterium]